MPDTKKKILIVDDEPNIRQLFVDTLSAQGFECLTAQNGLEGLNLSLTASPDIILLDLRMPEMDGLAMLRELRKKESGKNIPVIILSTVNDEKSVSEALQWGVSDFLEKSNWNVDELMERIRKNLVPPLT
jgi:two-component system KDP operon response regulator KdpE